MDFTRTLLLVMSHWMLAILVILYCGSLTDGAALKGKLAILCVPEDVLHLSHLIQVRHFCASS